MQMTISKTKNFFQLHSKLTGLLTLALFLAFLMSTSIPQAKADTSYPNPLDRYPGHWAYPVKGATLELPFTTMFAPSYKAPIFYGVSSWTKQPSQVQPVLSLDYNTSLIDFFEYNTLPDGILGTTVYTGYNPDGSYNTKNCPQIAGCTYRFVAVKLNKVKLDTFTYTERQAIAAHEFGHAMGLSHINTLYYDNSEDRDFSLMHPWRPYYGVDTKNPLAYDVATAFPTTLDFLNINALYPKS